MSFTGESGFAAPPGATPELEHWFAQIAAQIDGVIDDQLSLPLSPTEGGTGLETYTTGDVLYADAPDSLAKRPIGSEGQILKVVGGVPDWAPSAGQTAEALTRTNDTNVTLTLTGTPASALLEAVDIAVGWNGTLGLDRLPHFEAGTANLGADADLPTAPETALIFANVDGFDAFAHPGADRFLKALAAGGYQWSSSVEDTRIPDSDYSGQVLIGGSGGAWAKAGWGVEAAGSADRRFLSYPGGDVDLTATWETLIEADLPSHSHAAENITSGTFGGATPGGGYEFTTTLTVDGVTGLVAGDIPALPASKITSGVFGPNRISHFDAGTTSLADDAGLPTAPEVAVVLANDSGFDVLANPGSDRFLNVNSVGDITWASVTGTVPDSDASGRLLIGDGSGGWTNSAWAVTSEEPVNPEFLRHPGGLNQTATWEAIQASDVPNLPASKITPGTFGSGGVYTFPTDLIVEGKIRGQGTSGEMAFLRDMDTSGSGATAWMSFYDGAVTRQGHIGLASALNSDLYVASDVGNVRLSGSSIIAQDSFTATTSGSVDQFFIERTGSITGKARFGFGGTGADLYFERENDAGTGWEGFYLVEGGHIGLGTTDVENWTSSVWRTVLESVSTSIAFHDSVPSLWIMSNLYHTGSDFYYKTTDEASAIQVYNGEVRLYAYPSGSANTLLGGSGNAGNPTLRVTTSGVELLSGDKLYLDGDTGTHTYIWEGSNDLVQIVTGGTATLSIRDTDGVWSPVSSATLGRTSNRWATGYFVDLNLTGRFTGQDIAFQADSTYDIGSPSVRPANIYTDFLSSTGNIVAAGQGYSTLESRSTGGSNITLNYNNGNSQKVTLTGSGATITLGGASTNQNSGATYTVFITASGGSRTYSTAGVTTWVTSAPDGSLAQDNTVVITIMVVGSTVLGWATSDFNTPV